MIGDILVDAENAHEYAKGIEGFRIVETAFCEKVDRESALIMKCPTGEKEEFWIKIIFENKKTLVRHYFRLIDAERTTPIVIESEWEMVLNETNFQCKCMIRRPKQIYYVNE